MRVRCIVYRAMGRFLGRRGSFGICGIVYSASRGPWRCYALLERFAMVNVAIGSVSGYGLRRVYRIVTRAIACCMVSRAIKQ